MKIKNDMVIKYYQEQQLASLTYEEVGVLFFLLLMLQDTEQMRFENTTDYMAKIILDREAEVEKIRRELPPDRKTIFETALATVCGQAENSKGAFHRLQDQLNEKGNKEKAEVETSKKPNDWDIIKRMALASGISEGEYENDLKYCIEQEADAREVNPLKIAKEAIKKYIGGNKLE